MPGGNFTGHRDFARVAKNSISRFVSGVLAVSTNDGVMFVMAFMQAPAAEGSENQDRSRRRGWPQDTQKYTDRRTARTASPVRRDVSARPTQAAGQCPCPALFLVG